MGKAILHSFKCSHVNSKLLREFKLQGSRPYVLYAITCGWMVLIWILTVYNVCFIVGEFLHQTLFLLLM